MTTEHYIHYNDKFGALQKIKFSEVFNMWVDSFGGKKQFVQKISKASPSELFAIPTTFLTFFMSEFRGTISMDIPQDYIYDPELYDMYINRVVSDVNNTPLGKNSIQSIITLIIIGLAILGLVSLCK